MFTLLSFLEVAPLVWGILAGAAYVVLIGSGRQWWQWLALAFVVGLLGLDSFGALTFWSPYYKIQAVQPAGQPGVVQIWANDIPHQTAYPISKLRQIEPFYFYPYEHIARSRLDNVLIVGAGSGNDVAVALSEGARHIDAVEIDPVIASLGRQYNVDRPYQSSRVSLHIDDGRAFLQTTKTKYNLILFALPDSLTLLPGQGYLRLENFLLDEQSMQVAWSRLAAGGVFAMYNYYEATLLNRYGEHAAAGLRRPTVRGDRLAACEPAPGRSHRSGDGWRPPLRVALQRPRGGARDRRPPVPIPRLEYDPGVLPVGDRHDPRRVGSPHPPRWSPREGDGELRRPRVHGGGVHFARDEERRAVRAAVRNDVVRQLARVRRRAPQRVPRGRDRLSREVAVSRRAVRGAPCRSRGRVARAAVVTSDTRSGL